MSARAAAAASQAVDAAPAARRRILIIDDEARLCAAMGLLLGHAHDVVTVTDAGAALDAVRSGPAFDMILCDLMMPGTSGMDLYAAVRRIAPDQAERMMFMTGGAFTLEARLFVERLPDRVLHKPFDVERVLTMLCRPTFGQRPEGAS